MKNPQLFEYVQKMRSQGFVDKDIIKKILESGYAKSDIDEIFYSDVITSHPELKPVIAPTPIASSLSSNNIKVEEKNTSISKPDFTLKVNSAPISQMENTPPAMTTPVSNVMPKNILQTSPVQSKKTFKSIFAIFFILICVAGGVFAYVNDINPFTKKVYTEENFLLNIFTKLATVNSSNYVLYVNGYMQDREVGRVPFYQTQEDKNITEKFERDLERMHTLNAVRALFRYTGNGLYPTSLSFEGVDDFKYYEEVNEEYLNEIRTTYKPINGGTGYEVSISFELQSIAQELFATINAEIEEMPEFYGLLTTSINQNTVTINNPDGGFAYFEIEGEVSTTFLQDLASAISSLEPDFSFTGEMNLKTASTTKGLDAQINISLEASSNNTTSKTVMDIIKKEKNLFMRFQDIPSALSNFLPIPENEWILATMEETFGLVSESEESLNLFELISSTDPAKKEVLLTILNKTNEYKIIKFVEKPKKEDFESKKTYKYSVRIDETTIIPFAIAVLEYVKNNETLKLSETQKQDIEVSISELKDPEYAKALQELIKNTSYFVWIDDQGYPIKFESKNIIVPNQDNEKLQQKQFVIELGVLMKDINNPIQIAAPSPYRKFEEVMEEIFSQMFMFESESVSE
jgi:hypothetical protein